MNSASYGNDIASYASKIKMLNQLSFPLIVGSGLPFQESLEIVI